MASETRPLDQEITALRQRAETAAAALARLTAERDALLVDERHARKVGAEAIERLNAEREAHALTAERYVAATTRADRFRAERDGALEHAAACICGCAWPSDHEDYGEDGWSCDDDSHECLLVSKAVAGVAVTLRQRAEQAEAQLAQAREVLRTLIAPCPYCSNPLCQCDHKWGDSCRCSAEWSESPALIKARAILAPEGPDTPSGEK